MLDIFSSIGLGAITGLVGPIVTGITNYKMKKLDMEQRAKDQAHEIALISAESTAMIEETKAKIEVVKEETKGAVELEEARAYVTSQTSEVPAFKESYMQMLPKWVQSVIAAMFAFTDVLKGTARPVLTYYVMGAATWVTYLCWNILDQKGIAALDAVKALDLFEKVVYFILYMATSAFTWWFTDRRTAKYMASYLEKK